MLAGATIFPAGEASICILFGVSIAPSRHGVHASAFPAHRYPIFANSKVVLVRTQFDSAFSFKSIKSDMCTPAVFVVGHCVIVRRIKGAAL